MPPRAAVDGVIGSYDREPGRRTALAALGAFTLHGVLHACTISHPYTLRVLGFVGTRHESLVIAAVVLAGVAHRREARGHHTSVAAA